MTVKPWTGFISSLMLAAGGLILDLPPLRRGDVC